MPLRAVLFDFDGLILDTEWPEVEVWRQIFVRYGRELPDSVWIGAIGRGAEQGALRPATLLAKWSGKSAEELEAEFQIPRMAQILSQAPLPGVLARLDEAVELGLKIAAVSSSKRAWVDGHLTRLGLRSRFEALFCAEDVAKTKPAPDLYLLALTSLGVLTEEAIVFEDSPTGVAAAKAAGLRVIAVPNRVTVQLDLSAADVVASSLASVSLAAW